MLVDRRTTEVMMATIKEAAGVAVEPKTYATKAMKQWRVEDVLDGVVVDGVVGGTNPTAAPVLRLGKTVTIR